MAEKNSKPEKGEQVEGFEAEVETPAGPKVEQVPVAFESPSMDATGVKPVDHDEDETVVIDPQTNKGVVRKATNAEMGIPTTGEDMSKFVAPVAPSNAPQPASFISGIRTDWVPDTDEETQAKIDKKNKKKKD